MPLVGTSDVQHLVGVGTKGGLYMINSQSHLFECNKRIITQVKIKIALCFVFCNSLTVTSASVIAYTNYVIIHNNHDYGLPIDEQLQYKTYHCLAV